MNENLIELVDYNADLTILSPFSVSILIVSIIWIFTAHRKNVLVPFLLCAFIVSETQRITLLGFDFTIIRLLIIASILRIGIKREHLGFRMLSIDKVFLAYVVLNMLIYVICNGGNALPNRLGFMVNMIGLFYVFRIQLYSIDVIDTYINVLGIVAIVVAAEMVYEKIFQVNLFSILQGLHEGVEIRNNKLRGKGSFGHSLLAGSFGATLAPIMTNLIRKKNKLFGVFAISSCFIIVVLSNTSGNVIALVAGVGVLLMWPMRFKMRYVKIGIVVTIIGLQLFMKVPFYWIIARIDIVGGSTSYHRSLLIDNAVRHFGEWWLIGTSSTAHWGWGMWDLTNQFVAEGVEGGLVCLILFVVLIGACFKFIGQTLLYTDIDQVQGKLLWSFGAALFAHVTAFFGMHYFGAQAFINFISLLCLIILLTEHYKSLNNFE